ncbi:MAG: GbsR/MarR family transcriptional regulator [Kineosporiaceae bacterium]
MQDHEALLRYVERFALVLREMGMPPMTARVLAYALAEDSDRYTATDLATALRASPAAISGAVRYLVQVRLLTREREPGTRSDLYVLRDDAWTRLMAWRLDTLDVLRDLLQDGAEAVGPTSAGGRRLAESADFMAFFREGLERLLDEWREKHGTEGV